jgi:Zn-dependent peptidase ImmA (M78 family)
MDLEQHRQLVKLAAFEAERTRLFAKTPHTAPIDPIETAIKCGCEVRFLSLSSLEGVYSPEPRPAIVIGSERPAGRRTFTCAHELGHHIFKHGMSIDDLDAQKHSSGKSPEEFLADVFAGFLLMSQTAVLRTLKDRGWQATSLQPEQVYRLANFFGVGYGTVTNHLASSLRLIPREYANELLKVTPKQIKSEFGVSASSGMLIVDYNWQHRAIDMEVGDTLVLPHEANIEAGTQIELIGEKDNSTVYRAIKPGYARSYCHKQKWAANIRISRKNYAGLAQYRFLEESEIE